MSSPNGCYLLIAFTVVVSVICIYSYHHYRKLQQCTTRYRILTDTMVDVVCSIDTETFRYSYISPSVQRLRGFTAAELIGKTIDECLSPRCQQEIRALIAKRAADLRTGTLGSDNAFTNELEQIHKDGSRVWTEVVTRYILNPHSGKVEIHSVTRDISERRSTETAHALILKNLERSKSEQLQMVSMASHEFRTSAAIIKTSLDSLTILKDRTPPEIAQRLENIGLASLRLTKLANRLISNERLQELACHPKKELIELTQLVLEVVNTYPSEVALYKQLPNHPVLINADATLLDIALHNLIDNALRYHATADSPICITLDESNDMTGLCVEIRVADLGPGIPDNEKDKVFDRFYSTKEGGCNGLGLSIVHFVAHAHSGTVTAIDNAPCGAVFVIKLPVAHALQPN